MAQKTNELKAPRRGNLKWECFRWTLVTFLGVLVLMGAYDFIAYKWADSGNVGKECLLRFSYVHISVLMAFVASVFSFLAIVVTAKVNETMSLHSFNNRYGDDKMLGAVRLVSDVGNRWKCDLEARKSKEASPFDTPPKAHNRSEKCNPKSRIAIENMKTFVTDSDRYFPWTDEEDKARRAVKNYFSSALELYRCGAISKKTLRVICDTDALTLLFNVIEPMELIINEQYKFDVFYDLMKVVKDVYARKVLESKAHKKARHFRVA